MVCLVIHTAANQGGSGNGGGKQVFGFGHGRVSWGGLGKSGIIAAVRRGFVGCFGDRAGICARLGWLGKKCGLGQFAAQSKGYLKAASRFFR